MATVEIFQYPLSLKPTLPAWEGLNVPWCETGGKTGTASHPGSAVAESIERTAAKESGRDPVEELRLAFEEGRQLGIQEGHQMEREAQKKAQSEAEISRASQAVEMAEALGREREQFLLKVEHEVVKLALAVAARILRRESQMDPLLLTGAVRVALGQLSRSTHARLRVPAADLDLWTETMAQIPNLSTRPEVLIGEGMRAGECAIETEVGSVDLGIRTQLGEIERGFFDRAGVTGNCAGAVGSDARKPAEHG